MITKIYKLNNEGKGIAKINDIITFIPYTLPNDEVDVKILKNYNKYNEGTLLKIINESNERRVPLCKYYYKCGGCNLMHQLYKYQLEYKKEKVLDNLKHISNIKLSNIEIISDNEFNYRNHITLNILNNHIGFYKNHTNEIIDIDKCVISNEKINNMIILIKEFVNKYKNHNIRRISIKAYKKILINIESINFKYIDEFYKYIKCDSLYINSEYKKGIKKVTEVLNNITYKISSDSFFQKNTSMTIKLYDYIKSLVNKNDNVLDLYCGTGSIGIYIANNCKNVFGIEIISNAIKDAKENKIINNIRNIDFKVGKVEDNIDDIKDIDTIIIDPPRIGLNRKAIKDIININASKIIYVSCNSTTLARDINLLKDNYDLKSIKLFDMFPNTYHVECVSVLHRKNLGK